MQDILKQSAKGLPRIVVHYRTNLEMKPEMNNTNWQ